MANGDEKKWWQFRKKKDDEKEDVTVEEQPKEEPQKYQSDQTINPKDYFQYYRDKTLNDERFVRLDNEGRKKVLNRFFDTYGKKYLDETGMGDQFEDYKSRWVDKAFEEHKLILPEDPKEEIDKKKDAVQPRSDFSKGLEFQFDYNKTYPSDNLVVRNTFSSDDLEDTQQANQYQRELAASFPVIAQQVYESDDYKYAKENPAYFIERIENDSKKLNKWLKDKTEFSSTEREAFINYMTEVSMDRMAVKLREEYKRKNPDADISQAVKKYAQPYTEWKEKGTFLDPGIDERVETPKTDEGAEQASLIDKYSQEITNHLLNVDVNNPLAQEKAALESEYAELEQETQEITQIVKDIEVWANQFDKFEDTYTDFETRYTKFRTGIDEQGAQLETERKALDEELKQIEEIDVEEDHQAAYVEHAKKVSTYNKKLQEYSTRVEQEGKVLEQEQIELAKIAKDKEGEYLKGYTKWNEKYDKAYSEYIKKVDAFNSKSDEFEDKVKDLAKEVLNNKTIRERLYEEVEDAALVLDYWEKRADILGKAFRGEIDTHAKPSPDAIAAANKMIRHAKAKFEAAARMYYNHEGPTDVEKDREYYKQAFSDNVLKGMGIGDAGEELSMLNPATQQEVLMAMGQIGRDIGVDFTEEELENMEISNAEGIVTFGGHLLPSMVQLVLLGRATSLIKMGTGLTKIQKGFQIIKNKELGKAVRIGLKDPVPTGWKVARTFKPTNFQKAYAFTASSMLDEAVFAGVGGFELGAITGMNTAHLLFPDLKFKGRLQILNPIIDLFYKSGIGATVGMEAGASGAGLVESAFSDKKMGDVFDQLYPNAEETSKRLLQNFVVNSILFGGMGMVTKGMQKQNTAPTGAKFDRFGNANWYSYYSPKMRDKVYKAAKDFEAKGYPDAAKELYTWLDLTKDPVTAQEMKKGRMESMEKALDVMPIGYLRELRQLHGEAIRMLEYQARQPSFDGTITIPIMEYGKLKKGQVFEAEGQWYEVIGKEKGKYQALNIKNGGVREFSLETFDKVIPYKINHPLEVPLRLESHYETVMILDRILQRKGRYGAEALKVGPKPPTGLPEGTGETYVMPPEPTKVQKKRAELERKQQEMVEETGTEPIEMPEYMKKEYSYGEPEKVTELPVQEFSEGFQKRQADVDATIDEYSKQIEDLEKQKKGKPVVERKEIQKNIDRLTIAGQRLEAELEGEVSDWVEQAKPFLETQVKDAIPDVSVDELENMLGDLWQKMTSPQEGDQGKSIGTILNELINEKTTKEPDITKPVQPEPEGQEVKKKEEPPEEKIKTAEDAAKQLIRSYVLRGDPIKSIQDGGLDEANTEFYAQVNGYANGKKQTGKIVVTKLHGEELDPPQIFSLQKLYESILEEAEKPKEEIPSPEAVEKPKEVDKRREGIEPEGIKQLEFLEGELPTKKPPKRDQIYPEQYGIAGEINPVLVPYKPRKVKDITKAFEQTVGKEELRPEMKGVYYDADNNLMVGSDAYILLTVPKEIEGESRIVDPKTDKIYEGNYLEYQNIIKKYRDETNTEELDIGDGNWLMDQINTMRKVSDFVVENLSTIRFILPDKQEVWFNPVNVYRTLNSLIQTGAKSIKLMYPPKDAASHPLLFINAEDQDHLSLSMPLMIEVSEDWKDMSRVWMTIDLADAGQVPVREKKGGSVKFQAKPPVVPEEKPKTEEPEGPKKVDVKDELKQMEDLLDDLDFDQGLNMAAGGDEGLDARTKMFNVSQKLVDKFIKQDIVPFDDIMKEIVPIIKLKNLQQLLPFLKAGYAGYWATAPVSVSEKMDINRAKEFDYTDLDALIGEMNKPDEPAQFNDIVDKLFYVPEIGDYVEVVRVEQWQNPEDGKIQAYGGIFEDIPDQFEKINVGILKAPIQIGGIEKKAVLVERFRNMIEKGMAQEVKRYNNPEYRKELKKVIEMFRSIGENEKADKLEMNLDREPVKPRLIAKEDWSWKDYIETQRRAAELAKFHNDIKSGRIMYDPIEPETFVIEDLLAVADSHVKRGDPISPYFKKHVPQELQDRIVKLINDHQKVLADLGLTREQFQDLYYLRNIFGNIGPSGAIYRAGAKARAFEKGYAGATYDQVQDAMEYLGKVVLEDEVSLKFIRERAFVWDVKNKIWKGNRIDNFRQLISIASDWGVTSKSAIREQSELAMVEISKVIAQDGNLSSGTKFSRILSIYNQFPSLSYRTGEIKEKQQYSTPPPIAYLMGAYTNASEVGRVLDTSAGNGSLFITARKGSVRANDIDPRRYRNLLSQGYRVFSEDSTHGLSRYLDGLVDAVHSNPPFGGPKEDYNGYPLSGEYVPVAYALESLKDSGKAAIIVGGHIDFKDNGQMKGKDLYFFNWLNKYFNVDDIIQIPGDFYKTMGASYPIKLILVNGRKPVPEGAAPLYSEKFELIETWNDLESRVSSVITKPHEKSILQPKVDAKRGDDSLVGGTEAPEVPDTRTEEPDATVSGQTGVVDPTGEPKPGGGVIPKPTGPDPGEGRRGVSGPNPEPPIIPKPNGGIGSQGGRRSPTFGEIRTKRDPGDLPTHNLGKPDQRVKRELGLTERTGDEVTPYVPLSNIGSGNFIVPASIAIEIEDALIQLKDEIGDIDEYVMSKLKYNSLDEMKESFFAEQVDGIGQAVFQIEGGNAMIIGHQTGTGKGRIASGVIRYAIENGKIPVFVTKSADLFTDLYRDLIDIGSPSYQPFIMNKQFASSGQKVKIFHPETGKTIYEVDPREVERVIGTKNNPGKMELPEGTQLIMTTYSQFATKGRDNAKRDFLMKLAQENDVVFVMDESHEASGMSNTGEFFMKWIEKTGGGSFLSATYAKRPDNMPLYSMKTVMKETNMDMEEMVEAIKAGGPALQEIITLQLAEAGQFSKIGFKMDAEVNYLIIGDTDATQRTYNPDLGKEMVKKFDKVTSVLREIIDFQQEYVNPLLSVMADEIKKMGAVVEGRKGTTEAGISNTPYFSRVWNIIDQLLLSSKVKEVIPLIVEDLEKGLKPVVALNSTMEAMFKQMVNNGELEKGEIIPLDFSYVFKRGMDTIIKYTEKDAEGNPEYKTLGPEDLTDLGRKRYYDLMEKIQQISTGIPISPIDILRKGIVDAGFDTVEITGRGTMFEMNEEMTEGTFVINDRGDKIKAINKFNNNPGVAAIINRAGSTGISMHSSTKFQDTSQRSMYILQNDLNINVVVQILGRVYRANQLNKPIYNLLTSTLPAEQRMFMMNAKKLKSLDANTSGNQKQSKSLVDIPDFLNKYGDQVVYEYLQENPGLNIMIGDPLKIGNNGDGEDVEKQNAAHRVTGKIQILPSEMQEEFNKDVVDRYEQLIEYLNSTGSNDLMVTSEELKAIIKKKQVTIGGQGGISSFGTDTILNTAEVNILRRPFNKKELDEELAKVPENHVNDLRNEMAKGIQKRVDEQIEKTREENEEKRKALRKKVNEKEGLSVEDKEREYKLKEAEITEHEEFRIQALENVADQNRNRFMRYMNYFYPGRVVEVPFSDEEQLDAVRMNKGVFISFDVNMSKPNPWIPSNFQLKFATTDSRRMFRIPASKTNHVDAVIGNSYHLSEREIQNTLENWDDQKKARTREIRHVVTQNVLQGMNTYKRGRLIQFTMKDGTIERGVLMPENWIAPSNDMARIPIKQAANIIKALSPYDLVESYNGDVMIKKLTFSDPQMYEIRVPSSTKRGSKYYSDEDLRRFVKNGFWEQRGDRMVAEFPEDFLQPILDVLGDRYKNVIEIESHKVQKGGDSTESFNAMERYGAGRYKPINRGGLSNPYNEVEKAEATGPTKLGGRIPVDPIPGGEAKPTWEIQLDLTKVTGHKVMFVRKPSPQNKRAAGAYYAGGGRVVIKWEEDLDTTAHEMGHALDDLFGLLGPEAQNILFNLQREWTYTVNGQEEHLWDYSMSPKKRKSADLGTKLKEGMAEFFRAYVMNPNETKAKFPATYDHVKKRITETDPEIWEAIGQFSTDIRNWWGSSSADKIASRIHLDRNQRPSPWVFRRENNQGQFQLTLWDRAARRITNMLDPLEVSYRWAMRKKGIDIDDPSQLNPSQNFEIVARLHLGLDVKMLNMFNKGFVDFNGNRIIDPVTKKPLSFNLLFEQLPSHTWKDMEVNKRKAIKYGMAERIVEIPELIQARQIRLDLSANVNKLPPLDILRKRRHGHIYDKFRGKINGILKLIEEGELDPDDVFLPEERYDFRDMVIVGVAQEGMTDYKIAQGAVEEYRKLKETNPDEYEWISNFNRVYRDIGEWVINYLTDSGMLSENGRDWILNTGLYYMAMRRLFALDPEELVQGKEPTSFNVSDGHMASGNTLQPKIVLHTFKGSHRALRDPIETLIEMSMRAVESAELNYVIQSYAMAFTPKFQRQVEKMDPISGEVTKEWEEYNREMYEGDPVKTQEIAWLSPVREPQSITFWYNGKARYLVVRNREIYKTMKQLLPESKGSGSVVMSIASFFPQLLRRAIVVAPPFIIRNVQRDLNHFLIVGDSKRFLKLRDVLHDKGIMDEFELSGAGQFGYMTRSKRGYYRVMKAAMLKVNKDPKKWLYNPYRMMQRVGSGVFGWMAQSERPVRMLQYKAAKREAKEKYKLSDFEANYYAGFKARDLMDFMVGGTWVKELNKIFIFTNAAVRGLEKVFRSFKRKPGSTSLALLIFSILPSILNTVLIHLFADDESKEEYLNQPDYMRDMFYRIPFGDSWLTIPKPFELGAIGSVFQRGTDQILLGDESAFDREFMNSIMHLLAPYDMAGLLGGYSGFVGILANRDYFRQKHIIPPDEEDISIMLRRTEYASKFGKLVQHKSDLLTKKEGHYLFDARMVDQLITGQLAYYGDYFLKVMEMVLPGESNRKYQWDLTDTGIWRSAPVYNTPDVSYLLREMETHPWLKDTEIYDVLNGLLMVYFRDDVQQNPEEMEKIDHVIRQFANETRKKIEPVNLYKVDEAKKALKLSKYE